jgi:NADH-quinone oxidoreductase subunit E
MLKTEEKDVIAVVETAIQKHGSHADALIPILLEINHELGYLPKEAFHAVRKRVNAPPDHMFISDGRLYSLATFYHMLSIDKPGRHVVQFCESAPCHVQGGREVWQALQDELQVHPGETSPDGRWTLVTVSCLGACGVGPVVVIDDEMFGNVTPEQLPDILAKYE